MNYIFQDVTNRQRIIEGDQGTTNQIFLNRYLQQDMGLLVESLVSVLNNVTRVFVQRHNFTLVNITYTRTGYSYGKCPSPPEEVVLPNTTLLFTFALTTKYYNVDTEYDPQFRHRIAPNAYIWGLDIISADNYITVQFSASDVLDFHLKPVYVENIKYMYNTVSILTKNAVIKRFAPYLDNVYHDYKKFWHMSIRNLLLRYNYKCLPYCREAWDTAYNLIDLDTTSALYFLLIVQKSDINLKYWNGFGKLQKLIENDALLYNATQFTEQFDEDYYTKILFYESEVDIEQYVNNIRIRMTTC